MVVAKTGQARAARSSLKPITRGFCKCVVTVLVRNELTPSVDASSTTNATLDTLTQTVRERENERASERERERERERSAYMVPS